MSPVAHTLDAVKASRGFTYLWLLFAVVCIGIGLGSVATVWHTAAVREKELELLFVGDQFRNAIAAYNLRNPTVGDGYPKTLADLLTDPNQLTTQRYLRRIYPDPLTGKAEWGLVKSPAGGIMGVFSLAEGTPQKMADFAPEDAGFSDARSYADWRFVAVPGVAGPVAGIAPVASVAAPAVPVDAPAPATAVAAAPMQSAVPESPPAPPPDCEKITAHDAVVCEAQLKRWGDAAACSNSAAQRAAACEQGARVLPPLIVRNR